MTQVLAKILEDPMLPEFSAQILDRLEFERKERQRFIDEVDDSAKAEFINGQIIMHSPAIDWHNVAQGNFFKLLDTFATLHSLGKVRQEKALCRFPRNDYEPDVVFFGPEKSAAITDETMLYPVPDFICEILSPSTRKRDRGVKYRDYEAQRVKEYWIFDPKIKVLEQYILSNRKFVLTHEASTGRVSSEAIDGFDIPIESLWDGEVCIEALFGMRPSR